MIDRFLPAVIRRLETNRPGRALLRAYRRLQARRDPDKPRVLCVGFQKTGTSSFAAAMRRLGFSHYGYDEDLEAARARGDLKRCLAWAEYFDSLDDLPWFSPDFVVAYRNRFPGSFYVLLERDERSWLRSYRGFYGAICSPEEALLRYRNHHGRMLEILADEPNVLRLNICAGEGYVKLCPFLGIDIPNELFPWVKPR